MMQTDWEPLKAELAEWRAAGLSLPLWWRDDDAVAPTDALDQLGTMSRDLGLPVHLAIIPKFAEPSLAEQCRANASFVPLVHGWSHENRARGAGKKAEFGEARSSATRDFADALTRMQTLFGADLVEMFVPPWNRIAPDLVPELRGLGYRALSTYTPRPARFAAEGVVQINTHIDPIFWRGGGGLVPVETLIAQIIETLQDRRHGRTDKHEPLGFLTHHLVHNTDIWDFTRKCLGTLLDGGAVPVNLLNLKDTLP